MTQWTYCLITVHVNNHITYHFCEYLNTRNKGKQGKLCSFSFFSVFLFHTRITSSPLWSLGLTNFDSERSYLEESLWINNWYYYALVDQKIQKMILWIMCNKIRSNKENCAKMSTSTMQASFMKASLASSHELSNDHW